MGQSLLSRASLSRAKKKSFTKAVEIGGSKPDQSEAQQNAGLKSKLLASLFEVSDAGKRLSVLDVGPALPETVAYFNRYRCQLHFIDLYSERIVKHQKQNSHKSLMLKHFQRLLGFREGTKFDICLFWDFLNFLDGPALEVFGEALLPYLHKDTKAHGFGVLNAKTGMLNQQYGIRDHEWISTRQRLDAQLICHPHSQTELKNKLAGFDIDRGTLLPDGRLEILFKAI